MSGTCDRFEQLLSRSMDGEIPPADRDPLREHLAACDRCRAAEAAWDRAARILAGTFSLRPQAGFADRVAERLASEPRPGRFRIAIRFRHVAAAAMLFLACGYGTWALLDALRPDGIGPGSSGPTAGAVPIGEASGSNLAATGPTGKPMPPGTGEAVLLIPGRVESGANLAWLHLATGAAVELAPETAVHLVAADRLRLERGSILVATAGASLNVETPAGEVIPHGTRFTVSVKRKGEEDMNIRNWVKVTVLAGTVSFVNAAGRVTAGPGEGVTAENGSAPVRHAEDLGLRFARYYEPVEYEVAPSLPATDFPLDPESISNWEEAVSRLGLSEAARARLLAQGSVAVPGFFRGEAADDVLKAYQRLKDLGEQVPLLVTTDALLHLYHIQFDESLKDIEERAFYRDARLLVRHLMNRSIELSADEDFRGPAELAAGYLAVADRLMGIDAATLRSEIERLGSPETHEPASASAAEAILAWLPDLPAAADLPAHIEGAVEHDIARALEHSGFADSALFEYTEDFSQYKPRGHYDRTKVLEAYFRGMMWLGRMTGILKGGEPYGPGDAPYLVSTETADRQTRMGATLAALLSEDLPDGRRASEVWERLYSVTAYYVGLADDLTPTHYTEALEKVSTKDLAPIEFARRVCTTDGDLLVFRWELAKLAPPAIYSGTGEQSTMDPRALMGEPSPEILNRVLAKTQGFRFMGQRFIPDSYWMGRLVFPTVGAPTNGRADMFTHVDGMRAFPRGLDVMALLGSERAGEILSETGDDAYRGYAEERDRLASEVDDLTDAQWNRNLYWSWLHCLRALVNPVPEGYPGFMRTEAWEDKSLNAALGSWSQLRHDTILYAKQSETLSLSSAPPPPPPGYIEPEIEFWARLTTLNSMTRRGLSDMDVLSDAATARLESLDVMLARLMAISKKELEGTDLTEEETRFLAALPEELEWVVAGSGKGAMRTSIVADVHTDQNSRQVLEEGTGNLELLVVAAPRPDGTFFLTAGPAFSYYEFRHPMNDRLTDGQWRDLLDSDEAPSRPVWTGSYRVE